MEFIGEERIEAPRAVVWAALNNAGLLRRCIPGCQSLEWTSDTELAATIKVKIGVLSFSLAGGISLTDIVPMQSYVIHAQGKGSLAGFAKGSAAVSLLDGDEGTILRYQSEAQVEGKIAQLGSNLITSSSHKLASRFFSDFSKAVTAGTDME